MKSTFNFSRIHLLFVRYFTENWRRDLITLAAFFIAMAVLPRLIPASSSILTPMHFSLILFIGGIHFSAHIFHEIHRPSSGMHYLHIPASRAEKFMVNGVLTLILFPLACFFLFYSALFLGNLLEPIIPPILNYPTIEISVLSHSPIIGKLLRNYITYHSLFFLGALIFKKHPTTKTIISMILFSIVFGIIQLCLARVLWLHMDFASLEALREKMIQWGEDMLGSRIMIYADYLLSGIVALFFWSVAYLKFKEKEV